MKPTIDKVWPLVLDYYTLPGNAAGHVRGTINDCISAGDVKGEAIARLLLQMSKTQRRKLALRYK